MQFPRSIVTPCIDDNSSSRIKLIHALGISFDIYAHAGDKLDEGSSSCNPIGLYQIPIHGC